MRINLLRKGDRVLSVTQDFIAIERKNGEVDVVHIDCTDGLPRIDFEHVVTIGYGNNTVELVNDAGDTVTTF